MSFSPQQLRRRQPPSLCRISSFFSSQRAHIDSSSINTRSPSPLSPGHYKVVGRFDFGILSFGVTYEIVWIIMFEDYERSVQLGRVTNKSSTLAKKKCELVDELDEKSVDKLDIATVYTTLDSREMHKELISFEKVNQWIHIPGGAVEAHSTMEREVEVELSFRFDVGGSPYCIVIEGFTIQPKL